MRRNVADTTMHSANLTQFGPVPDMAGFASGSAPLRFGCGYVPGIEALCPINDRASMELLRATAQEQGMVYTVLEIWKRGTTTPMYIAACVTIDSLTIERCAEIKRDVIEAARFFALLPAPVEETGSDEVPSEYSIVTQLDFR